MYLTTSTLYDIYNRNKQVFIHLQQHLLQTVHI